MDDRNAVTVKDSFSYQVVALGDSSYYLWIKKQNLMIDYLLEMGDETGLSYDSMQISTDSDDLW